MDEEAQSSNQSIRRYVVGTAGHVDHGKSSLVKALTGTDPDRLAEEKARQLTIDLGFAWLDLPDSVRVGIVDVPGHERFVRNMLAGIGGIDAALFVVAADEGPMPQTREHLAILDLLGVTNGVVALTKTDLVDDDWITIVEDEVRTMLEGTSLESSTILPVSAVRGAGLDELRVELSRILPRSGQSRSSGPARLPIDRVFSVQGFGTVVTGTTQGSSFQVGQAVEIMPRHLRARIRGIQSHGDSVDRIDPGSRAAINVTGVTVEDVERGDVLAATGVLKPSLRVDGHFTLTAESPRPLEQNDEIDMYIGSYQGPARVTLLDKERIEPGEEGWVQFRLNRPVSTLKGDRFIARQLSPSETIGGGVVIDPHPVRHKRFRQEVIGKLETLATGTPEDVVLNRISAELVDVPSLKNADPGGFEANAVATAITVLIDDGRAHQFAGEGSRDPDTAFITSTHYWESMQNDITTWLAAFHADFPVEPGAPREALRKHLGLTPPAFDVVVADAARNSIVHDDRSTIRHPSFRVVLPAESRSKADVFLQALRKSQYAPPAPSSFGIDDDVVLALASNDELVRIAKDMAFDRKAFSSMVERVLQFLADRDSITLAQFRDEFGTSRKYAQPVLEYLDYLKITRRVGDTRLRGPRAGAFDSMDSE